MERKNYHLESGTGTLTASDGSTTEVFYVIERSEGNLGSAARPIWIPWTEVKELDFRRSQVSEATMKEKGCLSLKLKNGSELGVEWRDGNWYGCSPEKLQDKTAAR